MLLIFCISCTPKAGISQKCFHHPIILLLDDCINDIDCVFVDLCPAKSDKYNIGRDLCGGIYSSSNRDQNDYIGSWKNRSSRSRPSHSSAGEDGNPWLYYSQYDLNGHPFIADIHSYSGGGYVKSIGTSWAEANSSVAYLRKNLWIDSLTRALFIEFTTYNNNDNYYCIVTLLLEFSHDGGAFPFTNVVTTRLDRYNSDFSFFLAACEISFLLLSLFYMWLEYKKFRVKSGRYFKSIGTYFELLTFAVTCLTFALLVVRFGVVKWTKKKYFDNPKKFTSFQYAATIDLAYGYALACVVFLAFLKVLKILRFNKNMLLLLSTIRYASKDLKYYGILFSVPCFGYIHWAYLMFGSQLVNYATYIRSVLSILNLLIGSNDFRNFETTNQIVGPIFYILFVVSMGFILITMFLCIVIDAFAVVREQLLYQKNKYKLIEFWYEKVRECMPSLKLRHYNQWRRRKGKRVDAAFTRITKKMDRIQHVVNNMLLQEYNETIEISDLALRIRTNSKKHGNKMRS